jgi:NADH-quinone oxidoreductase subunit J
LFFLLIGAEFFALTILIIYTGVIAVLFLFVVIMFNLRELKTQVRLVVFNPITIIALVKVFFMYELLLSAVRGLVNTTVPLDAANLHSLDVVYFISLFNEHWLPFLLSGLVIFIAMVGSIVITYPYHQNQ